MDTSIFHAKSLDDILAYKKKGGDIKVLSDSMEIPGGTLLHFFSAKADLEVISYLVETEKFNVNLEDYDKCTPLGYLLNNELLYFLDRGQVLTVNNNSQNANDIIDTIYYLIDQGAKCIYLGYEYDKEFINSFINKISKYKKP